MDNVIASRRALANATLVLMLGFVGSRLLGLVRETVLASSFGTAEYSIYVAAFRIPDFLFQVLAGAVLGSAFLPTFAGYIARGNRREGWLLASSVLNAVALATFVLSVIAWIFAPVLVPLLIPGWNKPEERDLCIQLTRIMLLAPVFFGASGIVTGILNGRKHFFAPAIAPLIYNLSIIGGAILLGNRMGIKGVAIGVACGAFAHLLIQLPALRRVGMEYAPRVVLRHPGVREVGRLMIPRAVGLGATQVNWLVITVLASFLPAGSLGALNWAWVLMMMPLGIFGMTIATAVFPTLAEQASLQQLDKMKETFLSSFRIIIFLMLPASLGLIVLREPLVAAIYQRGAFGEASTQATAYALAFYAIGLTAHGALEVINRGFFALHDTRTPVAVGVGSMVVNLALSLGLMRLFGHGGLALSLSLATILEAATLLFLLQGRLRGLIDRPTVVGIAKMAAGSFAMGLALLAFLRVKPAFQDLTGGRLIFAILAIVCGSGVYFATTWALRSRELQSLSQQALRRVGFGG